jgi:hypothetical protein
MNRSEFLHHVEKNIKLMEKKHEDYQSEGVELKDYFPFGSESYVQMLHVKTTRLVSLVRKEADPNYESIEDTVRDLINYSVFYLDFLENMVE